MSDTEQIREQLRTLVHDAQSVAYQHGFQVIHVVERTADGQSSAVAYFSNAPAAAEYARIERQDRQAGVVYHVRQVAVFHSAADCWALSIV